MKQDSLLIRKWISVMQLKEVLMSVGQWLRARCDKRYSVFLVPILTAAGSLCSRFPKSCVPWFIDCVYLEQRVLTKISESKSIVYNNFRSSIVHKSTKKRKWTQYLLDPVKFKG